MDDDDLDGDDGEGNDEGNDDCDDGNGSCAKDMEVDDKTVDGGGGFNMAALVFCLAGSFRSPSLASSS